MESTELIAAVAALILAVAGLITWTQRFFANLTEKLETELRRDINSLEGKIKEENSRREKLETRVRELEALVNQLQGKNEVLNSTNISLKSELKDAQKVNIALETDNRVKAQQIATLELQLKTSQEHNAALVKRVAELEAQVAAAVKAAVEEPPAA